METAGWNVLRTSWKFDSVATCHYYCPFREQSTSKATLKIQDHMPIN